MDFKTAVKTCFSKYVTFSGRAARSEYWYFILFTFVLGIVASIIDMVLFGIPAEGERRLEPVNTLASLAVFLPSLAAYIRRLHDVNRSGWWILISFTIIGLIPLFIWTVSKGTEGENKFGADPLKPKIVI